MRYITRALEIFGAVATAFIYVCGMWFLAFLFSIARGWYTYGVPIPIHYKNLTYEWAVTISLAAFVFFLYTEVKKWPRPNTKG